MTKEQSESNGKISTQKSPSEITYIDDISNTVYSLKALREEADETIKSLDELLEKKLQVDHSVAFLSPANEGYCIISPWGIDLKKSKVNTPKAPFSVWSALKDRVNTASAEKPLAEGDKVKLYFGDIKKDCVVKNIDNVSKSITFEVKNNCQVKSDKAQIVNSKILHSARYLEINYTMPTEIEPFLAGFLKFENRLTSLGTVSHQPGKWIFDLGKPTGEIGIINIGDLSYHYIPSKIEITSMILTDRYTTTE